MQRAEQNGRWRALAGLPQTGHRRTGPGIGATGPPEVVLLIASDIVSQRHNVKRRRIGVRRGGDRDRPAEAVFERAQAR